MPSVAYTAREIAAGRGRLERPLFTATLLAGMAFSLGEMNLFYAALTMAAAGFHLAAAWRHRELYVRRLVLNVGLLAAGLALLAKHLVVGEELLLTLGHYVIVILLCKLFERKQRRDHVQILVLGALLMLAASLICQALWFAAVAVAYLAMLCRTAMVLTLHGAMEASAGPTSWPGRALAVRLAVVLAAMLATGVVVFLVVPRSSLGAAAVLRSPLGRRTTGFADTVRLGDARTIYTSDRLVLQARPVNADGQTVTWSGPIYLRGKVFDEYSGSRWTVSHPVRRGWSRPAPASLLRHVSRLEVSMVPSLLPAAFAPHPCVDMECESLSFRPRPLDSLQYELLGVLGSEQMIRYTADVARGPLDDVELDYLNDVDPAGDVPPAPAVPRRVVELARQWCAELLERREAAGDDEAARGELDLAIARRVASRLASEYEYTLDLSQADSGRDGVDDFLFHLRRGHCEYFASAMTVMCQSLRVRARLATGFRADDVDEQGRYVVRERDAHAWTEVAASGGVWTTLDATPAASMEATHRGSWAMRATQWYRDLEFEWYDRVIGYDDEARRALTGGARALLATAWQAARDTATEMASAIRELMRSGRISGGLAWALALAMASGALVATGVVLLRRKAGGAPGRRRAAPRARGVPAFVKDLLRLVRRRGVAVLPSDTFREVTRQAAERLGLPSAELAGLCDLYYRLRWAGERAGEAELRAARQVVRRMGRTREQAPPR